MKKDSKRYPSWVCRDCGLRASKAMGNMPPAFRIFTYHEGICGVCGQTRAVTQPRDFFYPNFNMEE